MLRLVRDLTSQVKAWAPEKVFLASDNVGLKEAWGQFYPDGIPGCSMVADGNWQDSSWAFSMWPNCLFPNWRNCYWSCNWPSNTNFEQMLKGSRFFGTPISFSTDGGGGDHVAAEDRLSPHEWTDAQWAAGCRHSTRARRRAQHMCDI